MIFFVFVLKIGDGIILLDLSEYSETCIKRSPLGQSKSGLLRQVTSYKRFNLNELFYVRTRKE